MKVFFITVLILFAFASCHHTNDLHNESDNDEDLRDDSRTLHDEEHHSDDRTEHHKKSKDYKEDTFKRIPAIRRFIPDDYEPIFIKTRKDSKKTTHHHSNPTNRNFNDSENEYSSQDTDSDEFHPEDYPKVSTHSTSVPPVLVYDSPQDIIGRGYGLSVYRRPSLTRVINLASPPLRSISPLAYSIPTARNVIVGYPTLPRTVAYAYGSPGIPYDGLAPVQYIETGFDGFIKKKK